MANSQFYGRTDGVIKSSKWTLLENDTKSDQELL